MIARGLGVIAKQQQEHYEEMKEAARLVEKANPVEKWLGADKLRRLLRMLCLRNEADLVAAVLSTRRWYLSRRSFVWASCKMLWIQS